MGFHGQEQVLRGINFHKHVFLCKMNLLENCVFHLPLLTVLSLDRGKLSSLTHCELDHSALSGAGKWSQWKTRISPFHLIKRCVFSKIYFFVFCVFFFFTFLFNHCQYSVQFSCWVVSDSLQRHGLYQANSQSLLKLMSMMPSSHLILCWPLFLLPSICPSIRVLSNESVIRVMWPKYWSFSFSISPSNEYSGLISFRMDWLDPLVVQGTQESSSTPQFKSINSLVLSFLYSPTLTSIHDYWKNHSLD